MVEADRSDRRGGGTKHVRRVEAAAETGFHDRHFHAALGEAGEGERGGRLEVRAGFHRFAADDAGRRGLERRLLHPGPVDQKPFPNVLEVRRGVEARAHPAFLEHRRREAPGGPLAVRARNVEGVEGSFRPAQLRQERFDSVETPADRGDGTGVEQGRDGVPIPVQHM